MRGSIADAFREAARVHPERTVSAELRAVQSAPLPKNGAVGRFFITPHAVKRYIDRVQPRLSYEECLAELIVLTSAGRFVADYRGHTMAASFPGTKLELWRAPFVGTRSKPDIRSRRRFVVAYGECGELPQVVTVL